MIENKSILIVDDHEMFRDSLAFLIKKSFTNTFVDTGESYATLVAKLRSSQSFNVVLIDLNMPGMFGASTFEQLRAEFPRHCLVVVSGINDPEQIYAVMRSGANGYIPKTMSADGLMKALELILSGVSYFPMDLIARHTSTFSGKGETSFNGQVLTAKEDVIELLVAGHTNKEIGRSLDIEEVTVKARLKQAFRKLGVRNRAQAVRVALENKLL
ncbi:MAG: hypothetical protein CMH67_07655 [Nisaea sp.]|nr:hypothetical protein [Nisaea sp.]OUX95352.1 MAG: hypothetical protein CBB86_07685 [Candidatus Endolissoclinum sp. TMED26]